MRLPWLPELGESNIPEMGMEELAGDLLDHRFRFQSFLQQVFATIGGKDKSFLERLQFKSTTDFVRNLNRYFVHLENHWFSAATIQVGRVTVPAAFVQEKFRALQQLPLLNRLPEVASEVQQYVRTALGRKLSGDEKSQIREALVGASERATVLDLYRGFYQWVGRDDMFRMSGNVLEYADLFPLIYCKIRLEGMEPYHHVKHLVVDEMQDYTPIQYAVLLRLFPGKKTILGDESQAVNPYSSSAEDIERVFPQADVVKLHQSYRSTWEIAHFALGIKPNPELIAMERHGPVPEVKGFGTEEEEGQELKRLVGRFDHSNYQMLAILCKTPAQAKKIHSLLEGSDVYLLTEESTHFKEGVVIATIPLAKGLEFDEVIVPFAAAEHYHSASDRNLLYVACTRAMHQLTVTFTGKASPFDI
jgi:DNA helicase II / ATP-dependent DNA helicase PcrA